MRSPLHQSPLGVPALARRSIPSLRPITGRRSTKSVTWPAGVHLRFAPPRALAGHPTSIAAAVCHTDFDASPARQPTRPSGRERHLLRPNRSIPTWFNGVLTARCNSPTSRAFFRRRNRSSSTCETRKTWTLPLDVEAANRLAKARSTVQGSVKAGNKPRCTRRRLMSSRLVISLSAKDRNDLATKKSVCSNCSRRVESTRS